MPDKESVAAEPSDGTPSEALVDSTNGVAATNQLDDNVTDKAIDEIVAKEGDTVLAAEDAVNRRPEFAKPAAGLKAKLQRLAQNKWTWVGVVGLLLIIFGLPVTRYKILGLVLKKSVIISIHDSKSGMPVSNAQISLSGAAVKTDANGQAKLRTGVGKHTLEISKQYYQTAKSPYFVGFKAAPRTDYKLAATGRLVPLTVLNRITGKPLKGVEVHVLDTTAKTDAKGRATVALPTTKAKDLAKLSLTGYNTAAVTIEVTDSVVKANTFTVTPAGHLYFLSNLNGNIDVVKADLDGTNRKVVLAGTGKEDQSTTSLLASRDWRYLVLKARRDSALPAMYLIDTTSDKVIQFDNGDANFSLVGWYGHAFIYDLTRNSSSNWQAGRQVLKSYDADNLQLNQLDQNQAEGDANNYAQQSFTNYYIVAGAITYTTQWSLYAAGGTADAGSKTDTIRAVQANGQGKKDYQSLPVASTSYLQAALYEPQAVYYAVYGKTDSKPSYYAFEDQAVKPASIDDTAFGKVYPTFLLSPSGNQTFWTELRDGKNTLFVGDANAQSKKQLASLSNYSPYGWYSDDYTLVSKDSSELYIMPSSGLSGDQKPLKVTDYYKPAQTYNGYGYGYGGL